MGSIQDNFRKELKTFLNTVEKMGARSVEIRADYLYGRVEGKLFVDTHKMSVCSGVMKENMQVGDKILKEPPDVDGRFLVINYQLPRRSRSK
jgi:hypothetical protein